jgi:hypothetical protein
MPEHLLPPSSEHNEGQSSNPLDGLRPVPNVDVADISSIEAAQKVVRRNLKLPPMRHIGECYGRITTLERVIQETDGLTDDVSVQANLTAQTQVRSILSNIQETYGEDALWRYRSLLDKKAELAAVRQELIQS